MKPNCFKRHLVLTIIEYFFNMATHVLHFHIVSAILLEFGVTIAVWDNEMNWLKRPHWENIEALPRQV